MRNCKKISTAMVALLVSSNIACAQESTFNVDFAPGTPVVEAVRALGYRAEKNVVVNGDLIGTIALSLSNTTLNNALDLMSMANGFNYKIINNTVIVSNEKNLKQLKTFKVDNLDLETTAKQLSLFMPKEKININPDASTVTVEATTNQLAKVQTHLKSNDISQPQVLIKTIIVELSRSKAREMGLDFSSSTYSRGDHGINWFISAKHEETKGFGNLLAMPSITVFNGRKAKIMMGDKVPVFTSSNNTSGNVDASVSVDYKDVGVKLEVVPRINDYAKGVVTMDIKPSISTIAQWIKTDNNRAPQISTREASTILRVKAGETIYLGGLLKDQEIKNIKAIPFLSKLPILGELFKSRTINKEKTEVIIAITPEIIKDVDGIPQIHEQKNNNRLEATRRMALKDELSDNDNTIPSKPDSSFVKNFEEINNEIESQMALEKERETRTIPEHGPHKFRRMYEAYKRNAQSPHVALSSSVPIPKSNSFTTVPVSKNIERPKNKTTPTTNAAILQEIVATSQMLLKYLALLEKE